MLAKIDEDLKKHNISWLLFGSALYYLHHHPEAKVKDIDILLLEPNSYQKLMDLSLDDRVDYFDCRKRQAAQYLGREDVYVFSNRINRLEAATMCFRYNYDQDAFAPGLIIPQKEFFWYLKRIEFQSMKDRGYYKQEIAALLQQQGDVNLTGSYFGSNEQVNLQNTIIGMDYAQNNEYRWSSHCFSVIDYLNTKLKPKIHELLNEQKKQ